MMVGQPGRVHRVRIFIHQLVNLQGDHLCSHHHSPHHSHRVNRLDSPPHNPPHIPLLRSPAANLRRNRAVSPVINLAYNQHYSQTASQLSSLQCNQARSPPCIRLPLCRVVSQHLILVISRRRAQLSSPAHNLQCDPVFSPLHSQQINQQVDLLCSRVHSQARNQQTNQSVGQPLNRAIGQARSHRDDLPHNQAPNRVHSQLINHRINPQFSPQCVRPCNLLPNRQVSLRGTLACSLQTSLVSSQHLNQAMVQLFNQKAIRRLCLRCSRLHDPLRIHLPLTLRHNRHGSLVVTLVWRHRVNLCPVLPVNQLRDRPSNQLDVQAYSQQSNRRVSLANSLA